MNRRLIISSAIGAMFCVVLAFAAGSRGEGPKEQPSTASVILLDAAGGPAAVPFAGPSAAFVRDMSGRQLTVPSQPPPGWLKPRLDAFRFGRNPPAPRYINGYPYYVILVGA